MNVITGPAIARKYNPLGLETHEICRRDFERYIKWNYERWAKWNVKCNRVSKINKVEWKMYKKYERWLWNGSCMKEYAR